MGIFSFASSVISTVCSGVGSVLGAVGNFAVSVGTAIGGALSTVAGVIGSVAQALGAIKPEEKIDELGDRALQAADSGIQPDNFEKYDEYLDAIRSFEIDPEKSKSLSAESKQMAGLAVTAKSIEDKFDLREGTVGALSVLAAINSDYFTSERMLAWFNSDMPIEKIIDYFDSKLDAADTVEVEAELIRQDQEVTGRNETDIEKELNQVREEIEQKS